MPCEQSNEAGCDRPMSRCGDPDGNHPCKRPFTPTPMLWLAARQAKSSSVGFTLLESITVATIIGILSTMAATSWFSFLNTWRLNAAQDQTYQVMMMARSTAKQERRRWQASFRTTQT
ncbi:MAG: Tfp pilus assembly protein FimT/FimU, partial [Leptolyngbyaceae cyanobacterium]